MAEEQEQGFTIRDKRGSAPDPQEAADKHQTQEGPAAPRDEQRESAPLPPLDFSTFVLSLATTAQISLGLVPDPPSGVIAQNLPVAKQMIDILGMLREKTKGNLGKEEQDLLDGVLAGLRMTYVKVVEGRK